MDGALHMSAFGRKADIAITLSALVMCRAPYHIPAYRGGLDLCRVE